MLENARWAYDKALKLTAMLSGPEAPQGEEAQVLMQEILKFRDAAQRYASAAAPYVHPRLAAIKHDRCSRVLVTDDAQAACMSRARFASAYGSIRQ